MATPYRTDLGACDARAARRKYRPGMQQGEPCASVGYWQAQASLAQAMLDAGAPNPPYWHANLAAANANVAHWSTVLAALERGAKAPATPAGATRPSPGPKPRRN